MKTFLRGGSHRGLTGPTLMTVGIPDFSSTGIAAIDCPEPEIPSIANTLSTSITLRSPWMVRAVT